MKHTDSAAAKSIFQQAFYSSQREQSWLRSAVNNGADAKPLSQAPRETMSDYTSALDRIFESRARHRWSDTPVSIEQIHQLYNYVKMGPTSLNSSPARFVFVTSQAERSRLSSHAFDNNKSKVETAPCVVIVAYDEGFYEHMPKLLPIKAGIKDTLAANPKLAHDTAFRNGSLQGAYLMVAARLLGLDVGPMSGFNNAALDADFFAGTTWKSNFLCAIGYANDELFPRLPRLSFEEAAQII
jgi:3-hydroxypropanoate dehydrogenase